MATILEIIQSKLSRFGMDISDSDISALGVDPNIDSKTIDYRTVLISLIPELLAMPNMSQGSTSVSWDRNGILKYYAWLCSETGTKNQLADDRIKNLSNRW